MEAIESTAALGRPVPVGDGDLEGDHAVAGASGLGERPGFQVTEPVRMANHRAVGVASAGSYSSAFMPPPSLSDGDLLRSLHRLARDLSVVETPAPFMRAAFASISRESKLLAAVFEDLLLCASWDLPRSASLCLREVLLVLQCFNAVVANCSARSRTLLVLQSDEVDPELRALHHDLATLLDLLPVMELGLTDDTIDLLALTSRQCRRCSTFAELKASVLLLIDEIEREIVPGRERLEEILQEVGINDPASCSDEIAILQREISDPALERWTASMIALVGLLRYANCVLFSDTPLPSDAKAHADVEDGKSAAHPPDLRCPISLDLMRDPVVVASGQTYDRESIDRWFGSGKLTCPRTGKVLPNLELVPNKSLKNLVSNWCRENGVAMEVCEASKIKQAQAVSANKAALAVARMTASFLVNKLSISFSPEAANRVVHEIRLLSNSVSSNCELVGEAGAVPMLVPLLYSEDAGLQLNAVTALLNLSVLDANKKRVMDADGAIDALTHVMCSVTTWHAKENAAAAVLSLASVHTYCRMLGENTSLVEKLVHLARTGPVCTKKDTLTALLSLAGVTDNVGNLVDAGVAEAAFSAISDEETAAAVLAALAKRGGAAAIINIDGAVARLVTEMRCGTEWARERAAVALVLLCQHLGAQAVTQVMAVSGVESAIWELMVTGTERARRKAALLGRICRRWAANDEQAAESSMEPPAMMAS